MLTILRKRFSITIIQKIKEALMKSLFDKPSYQELEYRVRELETKIQELAQVEAERKLAVEALRESEAKYRRVSDNSPAVLYQFLIDPNGVYSFLYVSDVVITIFGVLPEDVVKDATTLFGIGSGGTD